MLTSYLDLNFEINKKVDNSRCANGIDIRIVILGPIALFSIFKLTTSSGMHLEDLSHAQIFSLVNKLISSRKNSDDLSIGFGRNRNRRKDELALNKNTKGKCHLRIMLKGVLGFAKCQEKATYGLGYKLTLTGNKDDAVIDKPAGIADARIKIDHIHWYVPHYIPSLSHENILMNQKKHQQFSGILNDQFFMKEVNNQNLWSFDLGSHENMNVPIWIIIGFQQ